MGLRGVKAKQPVTVDGDKIITTYYALSHNKHFGIVKQKRSRKGHSVYSLVKLNKGGKLAKSQVAILSDKIFNTVGDAKHAIRLWDTNLA